MTKEELEKYANYVENPSKELIQEVNIFIKKSKLYLNNSFIKELQKYLFDNAIEYKYDLDPESITDVLIKQNIDLEQTVEEFLSKSYSENKRYNKQLSYAEEMDTFILILSIDIVNDFIEEYFKNKLNIELSNEDRDYILLRSELRFYSIMGPFDAIALAEFVGITDMSLKNVKNYKVKEQ